MFSWSHASSHCADSVHPAAALPRPGLGPVPEGPRPDGAVVAGRARGPTIGGSATPDGCVRLPSHQCPGRNAAIGGSATPGGCLRLLSHRCGAGGASSTVSAPRRWNPHRSRNGSPADPPEPHPTARSWPFRRPTPRGATAGQPQDHWTYGSAAAGPPAPRQRSLRSTSTDEERPRSHRGGHGVGRGAKPQTPPPSSRPPSAVIVWPVSQEASSESRKPTTPAMSSGRPRRFSG